LSGIYIRGGAVAPGIVSIGDELGSILIIHRNDVALHVLFEEIGIKIAVCIGRSAIAVADGRACLVVEINQGVLLCVVEENGFLDDLGAVDRVFVAKGVAVVKFLGGANAVRIVKKAEALAGAAAPGLQLPSLPGQRLTANGKGISDGVIGDALTVEIGQKITPRGVTVGIADGGLHRTQGGGGKGVGLFGGDISPVVIGIDVGFSQGAVVLPHHKPRLPHVSPLRKMIDPGI